MLNVHSGTELLPKRESQHGNQIPRKVVEISVPEIQPSALSSEEWGIINAILYAANDASQIRQIMQSSAATVNFGDKAIAQHLFSLGKKLLVKKKYGKAGRLFTAAKVIDPHLIDAYILRAETYIQRKNYEKAIKILKCAIRRNPGNEDLLHYSADLAAAEGDCDGLVYFYRSMLFFNPQDARTFLDLLQLLTDHARFEQFVEIADSYPLPDMDQRNLFRAYNLLVNGYEEMKQYEKALYYADAALAIKPKRIALWEAKATIYRKLGHNEEAFKCLQQMVRIKPHAKAYNENAYVFGKKHHLL